MLFPSEARSILGVFEPTLSAPTMPRDIKSEMERGDIDKGEEERKEERRKERRKKRDDKKKKEKADITKKGDNASKGSSDLRQPEKLSHANTCQANTVDSHRDASVIQPDDVDTFPSGSNCITTGVVVEHRENQKLFMDILEPSIRCHAGILNSVSRELEVSIQSILNSVLRELEVSIQNVLKDFTTTMAELNPILKENIGKKIGEHNATGSDDGGTYT